MTANAVIVALAAVLALSIAGVVAQSQRTSTVEVRIWEDVEDPSAHLVSHRPPAASGASPSPSRTCTTASCRAGATATGTPS